MTILFGDLQTLLSHYSQQVAGDYHSSEIIAKRSEAVNALYAAAGIKLQQGHKQAEYAKNVHDMILTAGRAVKHTDPSLHKQYLKGLFIVQRMFKATCENSGVKFRSLALVLSLASWALGKNTNSSILQHNPNGVL